VIEGFHRDCHFVQKLLGYYPASILVGNQRFRANIRTKISPETLVSCQRMTQGNNPEAFIQKEDRQCMYHVTLRRVREITVAVEKQ
jgi:hypothetical protein